MTYLLLALIPILFVSIDATNASHPSAFITGFHAGLANQSEPCDTYKSTLTADENICQNAYDQGQNNLMKITPEYHYGLLAGKRDSINQTSSGNADRCNIYKSVFAHNACTKGYGASYHYYIQATLPTMTNTSEPAHCSANDKDPNSCYSIGQHDGSAAAIALIDICHRITPQPPPGHHSAQFFEGWNDGWNDANSAANNSGHIFDAKKCKK